MRWVSSLESWRVFRPSGEAPIVCGVVEVSNGEFLLGCWDRISALMLAGIGNVVVLGNGRESGSSAERVAFELVRETIGGGLRSRAMRGLKRRWRISGGTLGSYVDVVALLDFVVLE